MKLCNYNWNIINLEILRSYKIYTTELYIDKADHFEDFAIVNWRGYDVWFGRESGKKRFRYIYTSFLLIKPNFYKTNYGFSNKFKDIKIIFYGKM